MALLLGPGGFGLFGLYSSIQSLTQSVAGMGINGSGVRQIAVAAASGDKDRIAQTAAVLRRTAFLLGLLGALLLVTFSRQVSQVTFGNTEHTAAVSLLSLAVFFGLVSGGQGALIQGMRRIGDLAKMNVLSAFFGLCAAIPLVYLFRQKGVVLSLIAVACTTIVTSWWYSHKIDIERASVSLSQVRREASELLKLGSAFMASGLMTIGAAYAVRIFLLRNVGFEATGLYQSAWTLGGFYVGFVLQAMGADFYSSSHRQHPQPPRSQPSSERADARRSVISRARCAVHTNLCPPCDHAVLLRKVRSRSGSPALGLLGRRVTGYYLAYGVHYRGQRESKVIPSGRILMVGRSHRTCLGRRAVVRIKRGRYCLLRILYLPPVSHIPNCPPPQWLSLV